MRAVCVVVKATVVVPAFVVAAAAVKSTSWMVLLSLRGGASHAREKEAQQSAKENKFSRDYLFEKGSVESTHKVPTVCHSFTTHLDP